MLKNHGIEMELKVKQLEKLLWQLAVVKESGKDVTGELREELKKLVGETIFCIEAL